MKTPRVVTPAMHSVLTQLARGEKYGLDLVAGSGGLLRRGTVYVVLAAMEEELLIAGRDGAPVLDGEFRRRIYEITIIGRRAIKVCDGKGWRIINADWPNGTEPYRDRCGGCIACEEPEPVSKRGQDS